MSSSHSASAHGRFPFSQHGFPLLLCSFPPSRILSTMPPEARLRWRVGTSCTKEMSHHRRCWWSKTGWKTLTPLGSDMFVLHHVPLERKMFFAHILHVICFTGFRFTKCPSARMTFVSESVFVKKHWLVFELFDILNRYWAEIQQN